MRLSTPKMLTLSYLATAAVACAQYTPPPLSYTVIQQNSLFGPATTMSVYRDGSKAVIDMVQPGTHVRTIYDLQAHTTVSWDASQAGAECGNGSFKGDWGDPFVGSASLIDGLNKEQHPTPAGAETVNGVATKVSEFVVEGTAGKSKVWIDPKYGMIMRILMAQATGAPKVAFETTRMTFAAPPAAMFVPACKAGAPVPTDDDKIASITGGPGSDYAFANKGEPTNGGCMILFHVVRAGSMTPVTSGFQVFVDGKEVRVLPNGLARLVAMPKQFNLEVRVPSGGGTAPISRQCNKPQTTLLLVAKNWDKLGEGADWLWVKSGKFAGQ